MRHNRDEKRFDRTWSHVRSMMANMTNDLVTHGRIKTTTPRAKVLRSYAEKMITLGKDGSTAARRRAMAFMRNKTAVTKLFAEVAPQYKERNGGYTRILKIGFRPGDNADMAIIELVEGAKAAAEASAEKPRKAAAKRPKAATAAPKKTTKKAVAAEGEKKEAKPRARKTAEKKEGTEKKTTARKKTTPAE